MADSTKSCKSKNIGGGTTESFEWMKQSVAVAETRRN